MTEDEHSETFAEAVEDRFVGGSQASIKASQSMNGERAAKRARRQEKLGCWLLTVQVLGVLFLIWWMMELTPKNSIVVIGVMVVGLAAIGLLNGPVARSITLEERDRRFVKWCRWLGNAGEKGPDSAAPLVTAEERTSKELSGSLMNDFIPRIIILLAAIFVCWVVSIFSLRASGVALVAVVIAALAMMPFFQRRLREDREMRRILRLIETEKQRALGPPHKRRWECPAVFVSHTDQDTWSIEVFNRLCTVLYQHGFDVVQYSEFSWPDMRMVPAPTHAGASLSMSHNPEVAAQGDLFVVLEGDESLGQAVLGEVAVAASKRLPAFRISKSTASAESKLDGRLFLIGSAVIPDIGVDSFSHSTNEACERLREAAERYAAGFVAVWNERYGKPA